MKRREENRNEYVCNMSEMVEEEEEEEEDEDEDVAALSSLDNYQLCQKYQQVLDSLGHPVSVYRPGKSIDPVSHQVFMFFLSSQLQLKLHNAAAQLQQAREKVGHFAMTELSLLLTDLGSLYLRVYIQTYLTHLTG